MEFLKNPTATQLTTLFLLFGGIIFLFFWSPSASTFSFNLNSNSWPSLNSNLDGGGGGGGEISPADDLEKALRSASMADKTLIITIINKAYVENKIYNGATMLDIFLNSFWLGEGTKALLDHLLLVNMDQTSYNRCKFLRLNCYKLKTDGVDFSGEKIFMSNDFIKMMWRRTLFLLDVLKHGYNFIFTDTDVMWLRNPFTKLSSSTFEDFQISTDTFNGHPRSEDNQINTGFYFVRSNNRTISLFQTWYGEKDSSTGKKEQDVLQDLVRNGTLQRLGLTTTFLDTQFFNGFCSDSINFQKVLTFHANCCRSIKAKVADLTTLLADWSQFKALRANCSKGNVPSKHVACSNSWHQNVTLGT